MILMIITFIGNSMLFLRMKNYKKGHFSGKYFKIDFSGIFIKIVFDMIILIFILKMKHH